MSPEEYQWNINLILDRFGYLQLSYEQAAQVYRYEQQKNQSSEKHFFSEWEAWDYELTTFREILTDDQLIAYESLMEEQKAQYVKSLLEFDQERAPELSYHQELLTYYETQLLPEIFASDVLRFLTVTHDSAKIDFLRLEYKRFLADRKMAILTSHFRYNRAYKPNELKLELLRHQLHYIFPAVAYFKHNMDEPTRAVATYLADKFVVMAQRIEPLFNRKFDELKAFHDGIYNKYYGERRGGWHVEITPSSSIDEERKEIALLLLLLDKDKYGCGVG